MLISMGPEQIVPPDTSLSRSGIPTNIDRSLISTFDLRLSFDNFGLIAKIDIIP